MTKTQFSRYQIRREIGRGGMATVYLAYDPQFKRHVALKVLPAELSQNAELRGRFEREAHTIARLEHPAIVPVYDFGEHEGQLFLVMRLMNSSLADRIDHGPIEPGEAVTILRPIASALDKAHAQGIIHRDLKPGNILFDADGNAYLSDFGIVKLAESTAHFTVTGGIIGTPAYMSPEQAEGLVDIDYRSDIYALGAILYEMLSGVMPFRADTPIGVALKHITQPVPRLRETNANVADSYQKIIDSGMAKQRERRFGSATAMINALQAVVEQEGSAAADPTFVFKDMGDTLIVAEPRNATPNRAQPPVVPTPAPPPAAARPAPTPAPAPRAKGGVPSWVWPLLALIVIGGAVGGWAIFGRNSGDDGRDDRAGLIVPETAEPVAAAVPEPTEPPVTEPTEAPTAEATALPTDEPTALPTPSPTPVTVREVVLPTGLEVEMVLVPAGTFPFGDERGDADEQPVRDVYLNAFYIDRTEVTNKQFAECVIAKACVAHQEGSLTRETYFTDPVYADYPVIYVSWDDANAYCEWTGRRLPTEAEWEKAAKGNNAWLYPWGDTFDPSRLNYCDQSCQSTSRDAAGNDGFADTSPVGFYEAGASPYGAYDMSGNVWEWVADWYSETWYAEMPDSNPQGPETGTERVRRGLAWNLFGERTGQITDRAKADPARRGESIGFRCASNP